MRWDFPVEERNVYYFVPLTPDLDIEQLRSYLGNRGMLVECFDRKAVVRGDNYNYIATVSDYYALVPHEVVIQCVQNGIRAAGQRIVAASIHASANGARLFASYLLDAKKQLGNDLVFFGLRGVNSYDASYALRIELFGQITSNQLTLTPAGYGFTMSANQLDVPGIQLKLDLVMPHRGPRLGSEKYIEWLEKLKSRLTEAARLSCIGGYKYISEVLEKAVNTRLSEEQKTLLKKILTGEKQSEVIPKSHVIPKRIVEKLRIPKNPSLWEFYREVCRALTKEYATNPERRMEFERYASEILVESALGELLGEAGS